VRHELGAMAEMTRVERYITRRLADLTLRRAVFMIATFAVLLAIGAATLEWLIDPAIGTYGDALWWATSTVTTVGYGDVVPTSPGGRIVGGLLMLTGISLIPLITSAVVSILVTQRTKDAREAEMREMEEIIERLDRIEQRLSR
jgi:voltage-gated potassium channel